MPQQLDVATTVYALGVIGAGVVAIFAFVDQRNKLARADVVLEMNDLKARVTRLETGQGEATALIITAINQAPPECTDLRETLRKAVYALLPSKPLITP